MIWVWNFTLYSFFGFLLEVAFAKATGGRAQRKCLRVLPLCPVYGLGACLILLLPAAVKAHPPAVFLFGSLAATAAEYWMAVFYEKGLGVSFWDYHELPGNLQGRVCLPFSLAWGTLSLPLVYWVHPALAPWLAAVPAPVTWAALATLLADAALSTALLRIHGDIACLRGVRN